MEKRGTLERYLGCELSETGIYEQQGGYDREEKPKNKSHILVW